MATVSGSVATRAFQRNPKKMASTGGPVPEETEEQIRELLGSAELAQAIENESFKIFLDRIPIAIVISKLVRGEQRIVYANAAYDKITGQAASALAGRRWSALDAFRLEDDPDRKLSQVLPDADDFVGTFRREEPRPVLVEVYSGLIENDDAGRTYRIVAFIDVTQRAKAQREEFARQLRDKDLLLKELQHRVKNNLALITALIRLDARAQRSGDVVNLDVLAGRIEALQLLYHDLTVEALGQAVDLGHYISQIASAVMHTYAVEGIRLDLKVDYAPVSINVAMPVGLLVNELLTNAFKYAFTGRPGGMITVRCLREGEDQYRIVVADDGVGLPENATWPVAGKLGALILQSLQENAATDLEVTSAPGKGMRVNIVVTHRPAVSKPN
jgi:PAS domain S-box-containing protein